MKKFSYLSVLLLLMATLAVAQTPSDSGSPGQNDRGPHARRGMGGMPGMAGIPELGRDWWRNSEIAQQINLNDQQKQQLTQIFSSHKPNLIQLRSNVEIEEKKLAGLLDQDQPQQEQVLAEVGQLQSARNALEKEFTVMALAFRGVLTPDQWKQLRSLARDRMMNFRMHHSENGPRGNGPPPSQP
jgi:Spy/CpxP family protein refolding chaperone